MRKAYEFLAWLDQFMALRTTISNLDNEEHEDLSFNHQQEDESDKEETEGKEKGDQSESDDDTTKSPSVTAASNPTKKDSKRKIFNGNLESFAGMKKKSRNIEIEKKELNLVESLQESIMSKNKEKSESKNTTADDLFGKMVGENLKGFSPILKLQGRNEIQNVLFKYRMAAMQDSLQRQLNSTAIVDDIFSSSKTGKTQSSNHFGNNFQANFPPDSSIDQQIFIH